jgi:hypothetical protein
MIRRLILLLALAVLSPIPADDPGELATCKGGRPCKACRDCSACRYCHKDGGYCGVCSKPVPE